MTYSWHVIKHLKKALAQASSVWQRWRHEGRSARACRRRRLVNQRGEALISARSPLTLEQDRRGLMVLSVASPNTIDRFELVNFLTAGWLSHAMLTAGNWTHCLIKNRERTRKLSWWSVILFSTDEFRTDSNEYLLANGWSSSVNVLV